MKGNSKRAGEGAFFSSLLKHTRTLTHTHTHTFIQKTGFPPGLFVVGQEFKELQSLSHFNIYLTRYAMSLFLNTHFVGWCLGAG